MAMHTLSMAMAMVQLFKCLNALPALGSDRQLVRIAKVDVKNGKVESNDGKPISFLGVSLL